VRYVSTFSGIEAASVAWRNLGWEPLLFSEVEPFACAVLAHRFPNVPNLGDIQDIDWKKVNDDYGIIDVYIGGSPCQQFSVAGNRLGLRGSESRLMYEYIRAIRELNEASGGHSPRYVVFENVPGVLSSGPKGQKGADFGCLLRELDDCGYGLAWRVLDSQFARIPDGRKGRFVGPVPQRRRRVYLVGSLGGPGAEEILFERSCLRGNHPKGAKAREALTENPSESAGVGDCAGFKWYAGARARGIGYENGTSPTIAVSDSHVPAVIAQQPIVLQGDGTSSNGSQNGCGWNDSGFAYTLNGRDKQSVVCMTDTQSKTAIGELPALSRHSSKDAPVVCIADDNGKAAVDEDMCGSLKIGGGQPVIAYSRMEMT